LRQCRNEAQQQAHQGKQHIEILEKELVIYRTKSMKAEGDSHSSGATITRLQGQLNGKQNDIEMLMHARTELEKAVKTAKQETIDVEKRCDEIYRQLVSTKENLDILTNE
jgi:predicted CopG family antitoxin